MDSTNENWVECCEHGRSNAAYLCQHLVRGTDSEFYEPVPDLDEFGRSPEAWCNACDRDLQAQGWVWNDASERNLGFTLVCSACFEHARMRNALAGNRL